MLVHQFESSSGSAISIERVLDRLYAGMALLGAIAFVAVEGFILYQLGGQLFPYIPRSADEFAGYCMAASAFLALAYTFNANEHIRVTLISDRLGTRGQHRLAMLAVSIALALTGYLAWHMSKLAWQTWLLDERSTGLIALPLWIPQSAMAVGAIVFLIAVAQRAVRVWRGGSIELPSEAGGEHRADR